MLNVENHEPSRVARESSQPITLLISIVALVAYVLVLVGLLTPGQLPGENGWLEAILVLTVTLATLTSMLRQLPPQNIFLAAVIVSLLGGIAHGVCAATAIPFGPLMFTESAGPQLFRRLSWAMPLVWIIAVLNSRGVARLILRPWRKLKTRYGYWVIGLSAGLTVVFGAMLEPFASRVRHYWLWEETKLPFTWYGAPVTNFLGWTMVSLLILAFVTPVMIKKRKKSRDRNFFDYHPLIIWVLLDALFASGAATQHLWPAVILCVVAGVVVTIAAVRGSRW